MDVIIAVGYRVNSKKATKFRIWATKILKDYMIKDFVIDVEKMKNDPKYGRDYYDELLQTIKEIRLSERKSMKSLQNNKNINELEKLQHQLNNEKYLLE